MLSDLCGYCCVDLLLWNQCVLQSIPTLRTRMKNELEKVIKKIVDSLQTQLTSVNRGPFSLPRRPFVALLWRVSRACLVRVLRCRIRVGFVGFHKCNGERPVFSVASPYCFLGSFATIESILDTVLWVLLPKTTFAAVECWVWSWDRQSALQVVSKCVSVRTKARQASTADWVI
jgi:hypothetical protein